MTGDMGIRALLPPEAVEAIAERAAELLAERAALTPADQGFIDVDGASHYLACPKSRVYSLVSARRIPHHRDGSRLLFDRQELHAWVLAGGACRP